MNHNHNQKQNNQNTGKLELTGSSSTTAIESKQDSVAAIPEERQSTQREWMQLRDGTKEPVAAVVELSDGRIAKIAVGKGKHSLESQEIFSDESRDPKNLPKKSRLFSIQFSILITIDDKAQAPEDFEDLPMKDFNLIQVEYSQINF